LTTFFFIAGNLKIAYDLALYRLFRLVKTPEEQDELAMARPKDLQT
jgi:hypothetical protein